MYIFYIHTYSTMLLMVADTVLSTEQMSKNGTTNILLPLISMNYRAAYLNKTL